MLHLTQGLMIGFSFLLAAVLLIIPMPQDWQWLRPEWMMLTVLYWAVLLPRFVGVTTGWCVGLGMDILSGTLIGQHALSIALVAYLAYLLRYRVQFSPFWQQLFWILLLVGVGELVQLCIQWLTGYPLRGTLCWLSILSSVLFWPFLSRLLRTYAEKFQH